MSGKKPGPATDESAVPLLCNSLNAWQGGIRPQYPVLADLLLRAQETITKLYEENRVLKGEKE